MRFADARTALRLTPLFLAACTLSADPASNNPPSPLGSGLRIHDVQDPKASTYAANKNVNLTSDVVLWLDTFDETKDGKSQGTLYIQDVGSQAPYSGMSVYQPSYVPADLRVFPGDVLDFVGPYQEVTNIGKAIFTPPQTLPQLAKPVGTFRYEYQTPAPTTVTLSDLNEGNYATGRKWESMLVTVNDVYVQTPTVDSSGYRVTYALAGSAAAPADANAVAISNELYPLKTTDFPVGTHFKSVTGIATWFFSYHIAPRTPADLVQ